jgi:hypothetical protein
VPGVRDGMTNEVSYSVRKLAYLELINIQRTEPSPPVLISRGYMVDYALEIDLVKEKGVVCKGCVLYKSSTGINGACTGKCFW